MHFSDGQLFVLTGACCWCKPTTKNSPPKQGRWPVCSWFFATFCTLANDPLNTFLMNTAIGISTQAWYLPSRSAKKKHRNRTEGLVCDHSNDFLRCSVSLCHFDCPFMSMMDIAHCLFFVFSQTRFNHAIVLHRTPNPLEVPRPFIFHQGSFFMKNSPISVGGSHLSAVVRQSLEGSQNSWETNEFGGMVMVP